MSNSSRGPEGAAGATPQGTATGTGFPYADRIRPITPADPLRWLCAGWRDLRRAWWVSVPYGLIHVAVGYGLTVGLWALDMLYLLTPLIAGFLLVAPALSIGFYEISRRLEAGETVTFASALLAFRRNTFHLLTAGLVLMLFLMIWVRVAALIFAVSFPYINATPQALVEALLSWNGLVFLVVGSAFGAVFAAAAFLFSALALPAMVDRRTDVFTGATVSAVAVLRRPRAMLAWAALIVLFGGLGLAPALLGLAVTLPLLGHATWHAYRATVIPDGE